MRTATSSVRLWLGAFVMGLAIGMPEASAAITGFGDGSGYTLNYGFSFDTSGPTIVNNVLNLTQNVNLEHRSAFYNTAQNINQFQVHFQYQGTPYANTPLGDGATFTIQNDPRGVTAVGDSGSGLGYQGITSSVAIELNQFATFNGAGTFLGVNGSTGATTQGGYLPTGSVSLISGDPIGVDLNYNGSVLTERLTDLTTGAVFQIGYTINIAAIVGSSTAYIGFTGGTGLAETDQTISNFSMVVPEPASVLQLALGLLGVAGWAARRRVIVR